MNQKENHDQIDAKKDFRRFAGLHSWYKRLSFAEPSEFVAVPILGKQQQVGGTPIEDPDGLHWCFVEKHILLEYTTDPPKAKDLILQYSFFLNPMVYRDSYWENGVIWSPAIDDPNFQSHVKKTYPELWPKIESYFDHERIPRHDEPAIYEVYSKEYEKMEAEAITVCEKVWKDLVDNEIVIRDIKTKKKTSQ